MQMMVTIRIKRSDFNFSFFYESQVERKIIPRNYIHKQQLKY